MRLLRYRRWLFLTTALAPMAAFGQGAVQQSGVVTPQHFTCWLGNGIVNDCGISSLNPLVLPVIASGHLLGNSTGSPTAAQDTTLTSLIDTLGTPAQGDVLYRNGSVWTLLHAGTSGQFLQTLGASANPAWATPTPIAYAGSASILLTGTVFSIAAPVTVPNGGTGLTAGTSGGIPAFTNASTIQSSALLTSHGVLLGGGAGAVPYSLTALGTSGQALISNGAAADPSWQNVNSGTVTNVATGSGLTGGPITNTGTIVCSTAGSGTAGCVTPDTNAAHVLNGAGSWIAPVAAGTGISVTGTTVAITNPNITGTTAAIGGGSVGAGACTSGTVTVTGATTAMVAAASPVTYPGDGITWLPYISASDTVTVKVCNYTTASVTPTSSAYVVKVIRG